MPSIASRLMPALLHLRASKAIYSSREATLKHIADLQLRPGSWAPPSTLDKIVDLSVRSVRGWPVYEVSPRGTATTARSVYLHGGAWIHEITARQWAFVAQLAADTGIRFTVPIYPLAPAGTAAGVIHTMTELVADVITGAGPANTTLIGDSAGGTIVLAVAMRLRDRGAPAARHTVLISPALDLTFTDPAMADLAPTDPWLDIPGPKAAAELWRGDLPIDDPLVSPINGALGGLAPITMFSGTRDMMNADARRFVQLARTANLPLTYHEAPGMLHDYPLMPTPEAKRARALVRAALAG